MNASQKNTTNAEMADPAYVSTLYKTDMADGNFVPLLTRLEHVIEHNVSIGSLIESKGAFIERVDHIAEQTASILHMTNAQASELVKTMGDLPVGATSTDQGPSPKGEIIPQDVQQLFDSCSSETLFTKNACRIITGIRAEMS